MEYLGITYAMKNIPELDPGFIPFGLWADAYRKDAQQPIAIAVEREEGNISVRKTVIHGTAAMAEADYRYLERYVKFLLWSVGGFRVRICGCSNLAKRLQADYTPGGKRDFDCTFVAQLYERPLEILDLPLEDCPEANEQAVPMGGHMDGCRIGFDAGGSDRKVSAVIDGECVYSEEVVWFPKLNPDPNYQYNEILTADSWGSRTVDESEAQALSALLVTPQGKAAQIPGPQIAVADAEGQIRSEGQYMILRRYPHPYGMNHHPKQTTKQHCQEHLRRSQKQPCRRHQLYIAAAHAAAFGYQKGNVENTADQYRTQQVNPPIVQIRYQPHSPEKCDKYVDSHRNLISSKINYAQRQQCGYKKAINNTIYIHPFDCND